MHWTHAAFRLVPVSRGENWAEPAHAPCYLHSRNALGSSIRQVAFGPHSFSGAIEIFFSSWDSFPFESDIHALAPYMDLHLALYHPSFGGPKGCYIVTASLATFLFCLLGHTHSDSFFL